MAHIHAAVYNGHDHRRPLLLRLLSLLAAGNHRPWLLLLRCGRRRRQAAAGCQGVRGDASAAAGAAAEPCFRRQQRQAQLVHRPLQAEVGVIGGTLS